MKSENLSQIAVRLHEDDAVAVLKKEVKEGVALEWHETRFLAKKTIPAGHKIALVGIPDGAPVRKYGQIIGFANGDIQAGDHVHSHNLMVKDFKRSESMAASGRDLPPGGEPLRDFLGYSRPGGKVGTRNYLAVISSVNCSATVAQYVKEQFKRDDLARDFPHIDGVIAFTHKGGCAMPPGPSLELLQRVLAGIARHPNIGGYLMVGLGCESNQIELMRKTQELDKVDSQAIPPSFMTIQSLGGVRKTVEAATASLLKMLPLVNTARRSRHPSAKLMLAENCGGSDGNSGITANPALGVAADELVRNGGTVVFGETPEIYGAEHLLMSRAVTAEVADQLAGMVRWWEDYAKMHGASINNNPSVGNKIGGLSTIYEKSLGAIAKGGQSPLAAVYQYAELVSSPGLCFMDTPGFDPVSMTGLVAGGCNVGVFTTGRGSVYGCKPTPCIKVATNTTMFNWMEEDMDLNAGTILEGLETVEQVGQRIFEKILSVASGERTKSEIAGMGDEEFAPWMPGPVF